jgi:TolB-like protein/tRNA A-37 threonylcarbamoyl transferase component Bud32/Tfp pilus assembly protein PilF
VSDERLVAHYRLRERLGAGAMGEVWLAEDTRLHRSVALKMLRADAAGDAEAAARLLREARVASVLTHPNVAVVYEVGSATTDDGETSFVAMERVRGRTLAEILRDGPLAAAAALPIARQVAEALADAHENGVVHRDVKPGNVMVNERGHVKVLDFGLARFFPREADESVTWSGRHGAIEGEIVGTLAYMSPEQVRGRRVDARSDVFSLGVVLYEMLGGRRPFAGDTNVGLVDAILREAPPPLAAEGPLAAGLASLASRMLEKDPGRRPQDMRAVLAEIDRVAAGQPSLPPPAGPVVAVLGFANLTGRPESEWLGTGLAETLAAGLAGVPGITILPRERLVEAVRAVGGGAETDDALATRVGREAGARYVVSGAHQAVGESVRVTARVAEAASGRVVHHAKLDGRLDAIFDVQDRLVADLAAVLQGEVPPEPPRAPGGTHDLDAYEAFSKGLLNLRAETQESLDRAIAFFERAIEIDSAYAHAHLNLGAALDLKGDFLGLPELSERSLAAIDRAIALRPDWSEAWRCRGSTLITLSRADEAIAAFERALALNPTEPGAHSGIARVHFVLRGDFAAAADRYERALALHPKSGWAALQFANCAAYLRDLPRAEAAARRAVTLQQASLSGRAGLVIVGAFIRLGQCFTLEGRYAEAVAEFERELEFLKSVDHALRTRVFIELHQRIGEARLRLGDEAGGRAALDLATEAYERRARSGAVDPSTPYYAACAYALLGDSGRALTCLELAAARRPALTRARGRIEPAFEGLGKEPRFRAIIDG